MKREAPQFIEGRKSRYTHKTWHCWDVNHSRHKNLSMQKIEINEEFDVNGEKALFPCDPSLSADNSVNCKCYLVFSKEKA